MQSSFETGGTHLLRIRRFMGCLSAPASLGCVMLMFASDEAGTLLFSMALTTVCAAALYKAISTKSDGILTIDQKGIWIEQLTDPIAVAGDRKRERTHISWSDIEFVDVGTGHTQKGHIAPNHTTIEPTKLLRKSRFMAHMSRTDWSVVIDHKSTQPAHIYATNMNRPVDTGKAIGNALWSRNLITANEE